ncbi:hypothetical protein SPFM12_00007 [Salmonella phage SPFM12]|nr:hypothetical protein SPFM12_00007 [Salmonella phage SPFM12]
MPPLQFRRGGSHIRHEAALAALRNALLLYFSPNPYVLSLRERIEKLAARENFNDASTVLLRMRSLYQASKYAIMEDTLSHAFDEIVTSRLMKTLLAYIASLPLGKKRDEINKEQLAKVVLELVPKASPAARALDIAKQNLFDASYDINNLLITQSTRIELDGESIIRDKVEQTVKDYYAVLDKVRRDNSRERFDTPDLVLRFITDLNTRTNMQERSEYFCSPEYPNYDAVTAYSMLSLKFDIRRLGNWGLLYSSIYYHFFPKPVDMAAADVADREIHTAAVSLVTLLQFKLAGDPYNLSTVYTLHRMMSKYEDYLFEMIKESGTINTDWADTIRFYDSDRNRFFEDVLKVDNILKREGNVEWLGSNLLGVQCFKHVVIDRRFAKQIQLHVVGLVVAAEAMKNDRLRKVFDDDDTYSTGLYYDYGFGGYVPSYRDTGVKVAVESFGRDPFFAVNF